MVTLSRAVLDELDDLGHGLARNDHAGHALGAVRRRDLDAGEAVAVGGDGAHARCEPPASMRVEIDAVEVVARLLGRDRELRLLDQALEIGGRQREAMRQVAGGEIREIALGQGLQHEARAAGADLHLAHVAGHFERHLRAVRAACARCRRSCRPEPWWSRPRVMSAGIVSVTSMSRSVAFRRREPSSAAQQHVRQDRNGVAALDDAVHVPQRLQQSGALNSNSHNPTPDCR